MDPIPGFDPGSGIQDSNSPDPKSAHTPNKLQTLVSHKQTHILVLAWVVCLVWVVVVWVVVQVVCVVRVTLLVPSGRQKLSRLRCHGKKVLEQSRMRTNAARRGG